MSPIRASQKARYPTDWATVIVPRIRARSGGRCECTGDCGRDHDEETRAPAPTPTGTPLFDIGQRPTGGARPAVVPYSEARCEAVDAWLHPVTRSLVQLTVAHLDHQPENCADSNLLDMCQRCHLAYDTRHHAETRQDTRRAMLAEQMDQLPFDLPER